ncbi:MAG: hypothetical protein ACFFDN_50350, partial [Candidatus Hodarchaeota archaeon]
MRVKNKKQFYMIVLFSLLLFEFSAIYLISNISTYQVNLDDNDQPNLKKSDSNQDPNIYILEDIYTLDGPITGHLWSPDGT